MHIGFHYETFGFHCLLHSSQFIQEYKYVTICEEDHLHYNTRTFHPLQGYYRCIKPGSAKDDMGGNHYGYGLQEYKYRQAKALHSEGYAKDV